MKIMTLMALLTIVGLSQNMFPCVGSDKDFSDLEFKKAVEEGNLEKAQELVKLRHNPNIVNGEGISLLHVAVQHDHIPMIKFLISLGVQIDAPSEFGFVPFDFAQSVEAVKILIEAGGTSVNHLLLTTRNKEIINYLASKGFTNVTICLVSENGCRSVQRSSINLDEISCSHFGCIQHHLKDTGADDSLPAEQRFEPKETK
jgi:hypothetical protein